MALVLVRFGLNGLRKNFPYYKNQYSMNFIG